jgi:hypothetical protein
MIWITHKPGSGRSLASCPPGAEARHVRTWRSANAPCVHVANSGPTSGSPSSVNRSGTAIRRPANRLHFGGHQPNRDRTRENMKAISQVLITLAAVGTALRSSAGSSHAGLDNELSLVDGKDRTLTVQQWDTFLKGVFPLDRNRLTREWVPLRLRQVHRGRSRCPRVRGHSVAGLPDRLPLVTGRGYQLFLHDPQHPDRRW